MDLTNPKRLQEGDTIGIISPSAGLGELFPHRVENGEKMEGTPYTAHIVSLCYHVNSQPSY
jgi:muramoyltetrapeptide carboxypeptidase LdcA involved in peptidoglycan recycling